MKKVFLLFIRFYQIIISPIIHNLFIGFGCRHNPTCSNYTYGMIEKYDTIKGLKMGVKRILTCHPYHKNQKYV